MFCPLVYLCATCMPAPHDGQVMALNLPKTEVADGHELPCGYWKLNLDPLEEERMLLPTKPSL